MEIEAYRHKVQYYETDAMGIVHHSNYIRWFEEARADYLEKLGFGYDKMEKMGIVSPVIHVSCDYIGMMRFGETAKIKLTVYKYNGVEFYIRYEVYDEASGEVRTRGESRHCFLDKQSGKLILLKHSHPEVHTLLASCVEK